MRVIPLITVDDAALVASNVPETDHALYAGATPYAAGDRVRTTDHRIFESATGSNTGNDPTDPANVVSVENPSAPWIYVSKTNRWRAFDGLNSAKTRQAGTITYELLVSRTTEVIAFTGLEGSSVRVEVEAPAPLPAVYGPELIANGDFTDGTVTGWTIFRGATVTAASTQAAVTSSAAIGYGGLRQAIPTVIGRNYTITVDLTATSGANRGFLIKSDSPSDLTVNRVDAVGTTAPASGTVTFTATATTSHIFLASELVSQSATFDNISVKEEILPVRTTVFDETRQLLDTSTVQTYFQYFTYEAGDFVDAVVFYPISAFAGYKILITIDAGAGEAAVGIIGYGRRRVLGTLQQGTTPQIADYSTKEVNVFGERIIVQRPYAREIQFNIAIATEDYARVERVLIPLRATPAIYYESEALEHNLIVSGIYSDFSPPLQYAMTFATLTILGDI